ncbi:MAG: type II toxin-antitoxin system VapC family toxin [Porticoccaceae bacterium]
MKLLLDTCTFLWMGGQPDRLSTDARTALSDTDNELFLSPVSLWEILVNHMRGKRLPLKVPGDPEHYFAELRQRMGLISLPVTEAAVIQLPKLPPVHQDPFDRLLICQAIDQGLILVTPDAHISRYPIRTLW